MRSAYIFISDGDGIAKLQWKISNEKPKRKANERNKKLRNVIYIVENINHSTRQNEINFLFISFTSTACVTVWMLGTVSDILFLSLI